MSMPNYFWPLGFWLTDRPALQIFSEKSGHSILRSVGCNTGNSKLRRRDIIFVDQIHYLDNVELRVQVSWNSWECWHTVILLQRWYSKDWIASQSSQRPALLKKCRLKSQQPDSPIRNPWISSWRVSLWTRVSLSPRLKKLPCQTHVELSWTIHSTSVASPHFLS